MESDTIERLVADKMRELASRSDADLRAARSALWARTYELAADGWRRWPEVHRAVSGCMLNARRSPVLEGFDIEDDGSAEWQRVIDLIEMLLDALDEVAPIETLRSGMLAHLEGTFAVVVNRKAADLGRPISETEALALLDDDPEWQRERTFLLDL